MANVILAPHIDDEMIGCYSLFRQSKVNKVIYFYDLTPERMQEANDLSNRFGFEISFNGFQEPIGVDDVLYVPNIRDAHPHHKAVNRWAKQKSNKKFYYSIDMNTNYTVLDKEDQATKKHMLNRSYPSQSKLLEDEKYHLFESIIEDDSSKKIWVTFQREGIHHYPKALTDPKLADVSFLGHPHRHMFHFKVWIEVFHDDRDLEFIQFKRWLESLYTDSTLTLHNMSCEMIADALYYRIAKKYPGRYVKISVAEDNENGAEVEYL